MFVGLNNLMYLCINKSTNYMSGNVFNAIVIHPHLALTGVFDNGDVITCSSILYDEDVLTVHGSKWPVDSNGKRLPTIWFKANKEHPFGYHDYDYTNFSHWIEIPPVIAKKGTFKDIILMSKNGNEYSGQYLANIIGYQPITNWLKRLDN